MIFDHPKNAGEAKAILESNIFTEERLEKEFIEGDIVHWYQSWLDEKEREYVNEVLCDWLRSGSFELASWAISLAWELKIISMVPDLEAFKDKVLKLKLKEASFYFRLAAEAVKKIRE